MEFVSFEIAKKLKEKGFKEKCLAYYDIEDNVGLLYNTQYTNKILPCQYIDLLQSHNSGEAEIQPDDSEECVDAPTISQVLKWLREEKDIFVELYLYNEKYCYFIKDINKVNDDDYFHTCMNEDTTDDEFDSYEQAALAGIEYILDEII